MPPNIAMYAIEITNGAPARPVPVNYEGIMVYHPATQQYYSTKSKDYRAYERMVRERDPKTTNWAKAALVLRKLFAVNESYQFFVLPVKTRHVVEEWMASQGYRRVVTKMGEAANVRHVMFKITSQLNKVARYVVAPESEPREDLIASANKGLANWLRSTAGQHRNERNTMRIALRSQWTINNRVFEPESLVERTNYLDGYKHNEFRTLTMRYNEEEIIRFVRATITG